MKGVRGGTAAPALGYAAAWGLLLAPTPAPCGGCTCMAQLHHPWHLGPCGHPPHIHTLSGKQGAPRGPCPTCPWKQHPPGPCCRGPGF